MSFFLTFGVQYKRRPPTSWDGYGEPHPLHPDQIDGNGFVRVESDDYEQARLLAVQHFGTAWAFLNDGPPAALYAPLGELGVIDPAGLKWHEEAAA